MPPTPAADTTDEFVNGLPIGAGFRVPSIIVSPWTAGGYVAGENFDHTSQLRFLERVSGVAEPNISAWRRSTFGDLTSAFRFGSRAAAPTLPDTHGSLLLSEYEVGQLPAPNLPGAEQTMPRQERGRRPRV